MLLYSIGDWGDNIFNYEKSINYEKKVFLFTWKLKTKTMEN